VTCLVASVGQVAVAAAACSRIRCATASGLRGWFVPCAVNSGWPGSPVFSASHAFIAAAVGRSSGVTRLLATLAGAGDACEPVVGRDVGAGE